MGVFLLTWCWIVLNLNPPYTVKVSQEVKRVTAIDSTFYKSIAIDIATLDSLIEMKGKK